jgi:hypothetical protein
MSSLHATSKSVVTKSVVTVTFATGRREREAGATLPL